MKKVLALLIALCTVCGSAFAGVTVTDWGIHTYDKENDVFKPVFYDGLMEDSGTAGFTVHANSEMWVDENNPRAVFLSDNVSPGLIIDYKTTSFTVNITGFDDLLKYWVNIIDGNITNIEGISPENRGKISVGFYNDDPDYVLVYSIDWKGDGVYELGRKQYNGGGSSALENPFEATSVSFGFSVPQETFNEYHAYGYYIGDNTSGTVEFTFPESGTAEVPEPSSLLALAFGGAGIVGFAFRRR